MQQGTFRNRIILAVSLFLLWILLSGSLAAAELGIGMLVAVIATLATGRIEAFNGIKLNLNTPVAMLRYLVHFLIALLKANIDLARRVLTPALPINPGVVEVTTELKSDLGKLLLANSITLTPGTLTIDVKDQRLRVHWIDAQPGTDLTRATQTIAAGFERHIKGFLH